MTAWMTRHVVMYQWLGSANQRRDRDPMTNHRSGCVTLFERRLCYTQA